MKVSGPAMETVSPQPHIHDTPDARAMSSHKPHLDVVLRRHAGSGLYVAMILAVGVSRPVRCAAGEARKNETTKWVVTGQALDPVGAGIGDVTVQVEQGGDTDTEGRVLGRTTTDATGDFRIELHDRPKGPLFLRATKAGFAAFHTEVAFEEHETEAYVDIVMSGSLSVRGRVLDETTGRPIAGAVVSLLLPGRELETRTDETGRFELRGATSGNTMLVAQKDGFVRRRQSVSVSAGTDARELDLRLQPERPVRLRAVDDLGRAVPGAEINARVGREWSTVVTNEQGEGDLHGVSPAETTIFVRASHPDYVRVVGLDQRVELPSVGTQPAATAPSILTVTLQCGGTIAGSVIDSANDRPVAGARVMIGERFVHGMPTTWTDADGGFEIRGIPEGVAIITVQHPDYAPEIAEDVAWAGRTRRIQIRLSRGKPLAGIVVDGNGVGLDQVQVVCTRWRARDTIGLRTLTDEEGRFRFEHAPEGRMLFSFTKPGAKPLRDRVLTAGKTDYRIELRAAASQPAVAPSRPACEEPLPPPEHSPAAP